MTASSRHLTNHFPLLNELKRIEKENYRIGCVFCDNCDSSSSKPKAKWRCLQCTTGCSNLCDNCKSQHSSLKALRAHTVISMSEYAESAEVNDTSVQSTCPMHNAPIEMYCRDCMIVICKSCVTQQHQTHSITSVNEGVASEIFDLNLHMEAVSDRTKEFISEFERVKEIREELKVQKDTMQEKIESSFLEIYEILKSR